MKESRAAGNSNDGEQGRETGFKCPYCPGVFVSRYARDGHLRVHPEKLLLRTYEDMKLLNLHPLRVAVQSSRRRHVRPEIFRVGANGSDKPQQELRTIDYLAEWNSTCIDENTTKGHTARDSIYNGDGLNLELQLCSKIPDLELKLGF